MNTLLEHEGRQFFVQQDDFGGLSSPPFGGEQYPVLVWDHVGATPADERFALAQALIRGGCRYAVCGGSGCSEWEESFDEAFVMDHLDEPGQGGPDAMVMTTSHVEAPPREVALFYVLCTDFGGRSFRRFLLLHVGRGPLADELEEWVKRYALGYEGDADE